MKMHERSRWTIIHTGSSTTYLEDAKRFAYESTFERDLRVIDDRNNICHPISSEEFDSK